MTMRRPAPTLFYASREFVRWVRAAVAIMDESLANLCARQWHGTPQPIPVPVRARRTQGFRP
jgi:hypothetical protein